MRFIDGIIAFYHPHPVTQKLTQGPALLTYYGVITPPVVTVYVVVPDVPTVAGVAANV